MTSPEPMDPQRYAADLLTRAETMYADARAQARALDAMAVTATQGDVTVRVVPGGTLEGFTVAEGATASATALTRDFADAYAAAMTALTGRVAAHSGGLDATVAGLADPAPGPEADAPHAPMVAYSPVPETRPEPLPTDDAFDALLATLDDAPDDLQSFVNHPTFQRLQPGGDPETWQHDLERQVSAITAHADDLAEAARTIRGEHDSAVLRLEVGTGGRVERLVFKEAVRGSAPDEVATAVTEAYAEARADAERQLSEAAAALDIEEPEGPAEGERP
ncbi:hypothetical protein [Mariniluteicoccus flavus]